MVLPMTDFSGRTYRCFHSPRPESAEELPDALDGADFLFVAWDTEDIPEFLYQVPPEKLLVAEHWQSCFPQAGVLIPSSISGGELQTRFFEAAAAMPLRCWLLAEPLSMAFPLPCPDGQGVPVPPPQEEGFYAPALVCRYTHSPEGFVLFDTEETLSEKIRLAQEAGFLGYIRLP